MEEQEVVEQTAEQDNADFLSGFNAVRPDDAQALPEPKAAEPEPADDEPEVPVKDEAKEESKDEAEEPMFFGMSESQIKSLLERSARVDEIENQLRRAHGKIGELNANLQNFSTQQRPTQSAPAEAPSGDLDEWSKDFPEVAEIAKRIATETIKAQMSGQSPAQAAPVDETELATAINLAVMDATNEGWRETISSQDFTLWIATQPADVQETYNTTISAKELGKVLKGFEGWKTSTQDRSNKSKQRLEAAVMPSGSNSKVSHAPSAHDEFLAGFASVRGKY